MIIPKKLMSLVKADTNLAMRCFIQASLKVIKLQMSNSDNNSTKY